MEPARPTADATPSVDRDTVLLSGSRSECGSSPPSSDDPLVGQVLGDVEIIRPIAEGGMGRVYEGWQRIGAAASPRALHDTRRVAVKVLKAQFASDELKQRFSAEARLLARLDHPGIARIHAAGTHDLGGVSVPYIVMEYIPDALPLVAYADAARLSHRQRLSLFREASEAVAHGHLKGVIHRDLKPGNILVAGSGPLAGRPRVIDFGIARATDADTSRITQHHDSPQLLGTLQYMSPEQFEGDPDHIDIRTDVYSLGVVLYELLTGRPPYDVRRKTAFEAARIVRDTEPRPLTSLDRTLQRDVAAIATKCLEKSPARRYSSAAEVADDVSRYLEGRPITASPPGFLDGLVRLARRHRSAAAASLAGLAAGLAALVGIGIFAARAERQRAVAVRATERAERGKAAAEDLVQFMTFNLRDRLTELGRLDLLAGVLDRLARYHETTLDLANEGLEKPTAKQRRQREVFLNNLGDLERSLDRRESAEKAYREAFAIADAMATETPTSIEFQRDLSVSHQKLGMLAAENGDVSQARRHFVASREIRQRLVALAPGDPTREWDLAGSLDQLGQLALNAGDLTAARENFAELMAVMKRLVAIDPTNLDWRRDLAISFQKLGDLENKAGNSEAAQEHLNESLAILNELAAADPDNRQWRWDRCLTSEKLVSACAGSGDAVAARRHGEEALAIARDLAADDPQNISWRHQVAVCHERLGRLAQVNHETDAAAQHYRAFHEVVENLCVAQPGNTRWQRDMAVAYGHLGAVAFDNEDHAEARDCYRRGLEIAERLFTDSSDPAAVSFRLNILEPLKECHRRLGEHAEADACQSQIDVLRRGAG